MNIFYNYVVRTWACIVCVFIYYVYQNIMLIRIVNLYNTFSIVKVWFTVTDFFEQ